MKLPVKLVCKAYWPSIYKHRWLAVIMMVLCVAATCNKTVAPFLFRGLLNALIEESMDSVVLVLCGFFALHLSIQATWYFYDLFIALFELHGMSDSYRRCFAVIQAKSMRFFERTLPGSLVTAARRFCGNFENITDAFAYQLGRAFLLVVFTFVIFAWEYPALAVVFAIWIIVFCTASIVIAAFRLKRDLVAAEKESKIGGAFADSFANEATVKAFAMESAEQQRFNAVVEDWHKQCKSAWLFGIGLLRIQGFISWLFEISLMLMLIWGWRRGTVTVGDFVFFQTYGIILVEQLWQIGQVSHKVFKGVADGKEMAQRFDELPEVKDAPGARPLHVERGDIEFYNVNFSYVDCETRQHHDVHNFSLRISKGEIFAFVGPSGAGKSTLLKLLPRFFDLDSGYIQIDGQDIANVTQISLRQQISVVSQEPGLFNRSLRDNIAFSRPDALEEEIIAAAKRAHAWEFIQSLPKQTDGKKGLDIHVGNNGIMLSGGQRQRIALARAFLADAPILVLDEPTSALDSETEYLIQSAIADLLKGRTCFIAAHRLSTIQSADKIIVMNKGSIVEQGTHDQLLDYEGVYSRLWSRQSNGYISE